MEAVARLFLVRPPAYPGSAAADPARIPIDGTLDLEGHAADPRAMHELLQRLARRAPAALVSSPSARSLAVARALAPLCGLEPRQDARLAPRFLGNWQGQCPASLGPEWQQFLADRRRISALGAESLEALRARVLAGLDALAAEFHGREVLVVLHADAQRAALARALGLADGECFEPQPGQAIALDWAHPDAREFTHALIGMGVDWDVAAAAKQVHRFPGGASVLPRS